MVRIGFVQPRLESKATQRNIGRCIELASTLKTPDLVVFPELANTAYGFESRQELGEISEEIPGGPSSELLRKASKDLGCAMVAGIAERNGPYIHDSAIVLDSGEFVGRYRKVHLYGKEKLFFKPGRDSPRVYRLKKLRLAVLICLDLGFTDELVRLSSQGAQVIAHPANLAIPHSGPPETIRAKGNRAYVVSANRVGTDRAYSEAITFTGESMVLSPDLDILTLASGEEEQATLIDAALDLNASPPPISARGKL